jgi:hypothetical protein
MCKVVIGTKFTRKIYLMFLFLALSNIIILFPIIIFVLGFIIILPTLTIISTFPFIPI